MKTYSKLVVLMFLIVLVSCKSNLRLAISDLEFNPYNVGDTLLFCSDEGKKDTIIIDSVQRQILQDKCYSLLSCIPKMIFGDSWEGFYVNSSKPNESWSGTSFLTIKVEPNGIKTVNFNFKLKYACWYGVCENDLNKILTLPTIKFSTKTEELKDVIVIVSRNQEYRDRFDFVDRIYWSKSKGLVGFDLLNGEKWVVRNRKAPLNVV